MLQQQIEKKHIKKIVILYFKQHTIQHEQQHGVVHKI